MLKIRLKRYGRKKKAVYRIIVIDSKNKRDGKALEEVGFYDPFTKKTKINIERINNRITQGAQFTDTVEDIVNKLRLRKTNPDQ